MIIGSRLDLQLPTAVGFGRSLELMTGLSVARGARRCQLPALRCATLCGPGARTLSAARLPLAWAPGAALAPSPWHTMP